MIIRGCWTRRVAAFSGAVVLAVSCTDRTANDPSPATTRIDTLRLLRELRIDDSSGVALRRPVAVHRRPNGQLYVLDYGALSVFVFDSLGKLVTSIGRGGQGPGEFEAVQGFGFVGDTLWIVDPRLNRVTFFDPPSNEPRVLDIGGTRVNGIALHPLAYLRDGSLLYVPRYALQPGTTPSVAEPLLRVGKTRQDVDTLFFVHRPASLLVRNGARHTFVIQKFEALPLSALSTDHDEWLVLENRARGGIEEVKGTRFSERGVRMDTFTLRFDRKRITRASAESVVARATQEPAEVARALEWVTAPEYARSIHSLFLSRGIIWLQLGDGDTPGNWARLLESGSLQMVHLDRNVQPLYADGDRVWVLEPDSAATPGITQYRVLGSR